MISHGKLRFGLRPIGGRTDSGTFSGDSLRSDVRYGLPSDVDDSKPSTALRSLSPVTTQCDLRASAVSRSCVRTSCAADVMAALTSRVNHAGPRTPSSRA